MSDEDRPRIEELIPLPGWPHGDDDGARSEMSEHGEDSRMPAAESTDEAGGSRRARPSRCAKDSRTK
jgi:hypothetical protein